MALTENPLPTVTRNGPITVTDFFLGYGSVTGNGSVTVTDFFPVMSVTENLLQKKTKKENKFTQLKIDDLNIAQHPGCICRGACYKLESLTLLTLFSWSILILLSMWMLYSNSTPDPTSIFDMKIEVEVTPGSHWRR